MIPPHPRPSSRTWLEQRARSIVAAAARAIADHEKLMNHGQPSAASAFFNSLLGALELAEPGQDLVGGHDIAELLDHVLQRTSVLFVG